MRFNAAFMLATLACLSLSSCTFLRGGDEAEPVPAVETSLTPADDSVKDAGISSDETPADDGPREQVERPLRLKTLYSTASLNVRAGRGTSYPVVAGLTHGDAVEAARLENGWYELFADGRSVGFAHADYLSSEKPEPEVRDGVPSASFDTGLFGVSLPVGSSLVDRSPLREDADAIEMYRVPMAAEEIRAFYERELASLGWNSFPSETEGTLTWRKGDLAISVVLDSKGQRFTLTGGQR